MSRNEQLSGVMRTWRGYVLYFSAMGGLVAACLSMGGQLTNTLATLASGPDETKPRTLSRVEKHLAIKAAERTRVRPATKSIIVAMTAPELPPAALAAALDRTETASAAEFPDEHAAYDMARYLTERLADVQPMRIVLVQPSLAQRSTVLTFSALAYSTAPLVAGIACSATGCTETIRNGMAVAMAAPTPNNWPKPSRLGKGKPVTALTAQRPAGTTDRPKLTRKLTIASTPPAISSSPSTVAFPLTPIRIADTPGDIIHQSLRGTI